MLFRSMRRPKRTNSNAATAARSPNWRGQLHGVRCIQHGRAPARHVLYQCAVVAARWNETLRPHYQKLRARSMAAKSAYCAAARKLLVFLNALLRPTTATERYMKRFSSSSRSSAPARPATALPAGHSPQLHFIKTVATNHRLHFIETALTSF